MTNPATKGVHHIGFAVSKLEESASFFTSIPGWSEVKRNEEYPAIFVSDGIIMVTLWKNKEEPFNSFDRNKNVGLHHAAFMVDSEDDLNLTYKKLQQNEIKIEFPPEQLAQGPARHLICYEPSGIRIEIIWPGGK